MLLNVFDYKAKFQIHNPLAMYEGKIFTLIRDFRHTVQPPITGPSIHTPLFNPPGKGSPKTPYEIV